MEINQFAEFASAVVRQLPRDLNSAVAQMWIRDQGGLARALLLALGNRVCYELYLSPSQQSGGSITGFDLEKHLKEMNLLDRTFSLEDDLVRGWLKDPTTYPEEFKGKAVFLWKSQRGSGSDRIVAYLVWHGGSVVVDWLWLDNRWNESYPVLLVSS